MAESVKRPVQFNITNHIDKCMQEAQEQKQWIDNGGLYYTSTVKLFKERADKLRKIAECYDSMYAHFSSTAICSIKTEPQLSIPMDNSTDVHLLQSNSHVEYTTPAELTSLELIDEYTKLKNSHSSTSIELAKRLKHKIGTGMDRLEAFAQDKSVIRVPELFCLSLTKWFDERCEWPISSRAGRIRYNLSKFNVALDAMILAFSSDIIINENIEPISAREFVKQLNDWLYTEGEGHIRGEPKPYDNERGGLVSQHIVAFSIDCKEYFDPLNKLKPDSKIFYLACYLENLVKPIIYQDYIQLYGDKTECAEYYLRSVSTRVINQYHSDVGNLTQEELYNYFVSEDHNEFDL